MRDLAWDDLRLVREVARAGGMAGAAAALGVDHSTVFRRLGSIETALATRLFERRRSGYVLTPAGEDMARIAERFEQDITEFSRRLEGGEISARGEIRVATADSLLAFLLTDLFAQFRKVCPAITLDLVIGNPALNLSRRDADVAIRATDKPPENLVGRRIGTIAWALYGRGDAAPVAGKDLAEVDWVVLADEMSGLSVVRHAHRHVPPERLVYKANTVLGLAAAVEAGVGIGHLPCFIGDQSRGLVRLGQPEPEFAAGLWLLTHPDIRKSPRIRAFLDFMGAELQKLKPLLEGVRDVTMASPIESTAAAD